MNDDIVASISYDSPSVIADLLDATAAYIHVNGLHKGSFRADSDGPNQPSCVLGAMGAVRIKMSLPNEARKLATAHLAKHLGVSEGHDVAIWNDAPERTVDEVLDALAKTAWNVREGVE